MLWRARPGRRGAAAGRGGGGGRRRRRAVEPLRRSFLAAASPKTLSAQRDSALLATYRPAPRLGSRRARVAAPEAPRSKCALCCAVLCRAEPCGAGSWGCGAVAAAPRAGAARGAGHVGAAGDGRDAPPQLRPLRRRGWIRGCAAPRGLRQGGRGEAAGVPGDWEGKGRQSSFRPVLAGGCRALRCVCRGLSASAPLNACLVGFFCGKG